MKVRTINIFLAGLCFIIGFVNIGVAEEQIRERRNPVISPHIYDNPGDEVKVWISFRDKGESGTEALSAVIEEGYLTERALERRKKVGSGVEFCDLPVFEEYVGAVSKYALSVGKVSRWLNAVSLTCQKEKLEQIAEKDFVSEIRLVARGERTESIDWDAGYSWTGVEGYNEDFEYLGHEGAFYGNSYDQLDQLQVIQAQRRGYYGEDVLIAVLDGGFMTDHQALVHADVIDCWDFINNDGDVGYDPEQDVKGQPGHGTMCLSNIAGYSPGNLIGTSPFASFLLAKSEDIRSETPIEEDNMVAAFEWCERMGADVLSTSLSYMDWYVKADFDGHTAYASLAADRAVKLGMMIVTSQGNSGPRPMTIGTPGDAELAVAVGAVDSLGMLTGFSSRGPTADGRIKPNILAMGRHVTIAAAHTWDVYRLANGTSFACPLAAGGIALVIEAHPDWTPWKVMEAIENTATRASYPDNDWGYGILQVCKAIDYPSISGYVLDVNGKAMKGAMVYFDSDAGDTTGVEVTDENGYYLLKNMPEGGYELKVKTGESDESKGKFVKVPPDDVMDFVIGD